MLTPRALDVPTSPKTMTPGSAHTKSSPNLSFFQFAAVSGSDQLPADARGEASMLSRRLVWGSTRLERDPALRYRGYGKTPLIPRVILEAPNRVHLAAAGKYNAKVGSTEALSEVLEALKGDPSGPQLLLEEKSTAPGAIGWTPLMHSVRTGQLDDVRTLLSLGADPNTRDNIGNTPLHKAAIAGAVSKVRLLIDHGAELEAHNKYGRTPLHEAAHIGWRDVAGLLVRLGANAHAKDGPLLDGQTPWQVAHDAGWSDVCAALKANERRRVHLAGGSTMLYSADFPTREPIPFSPKTTLKPDTTWGKDSKHGIWGTVPDYTKPLFPPRKTDPMSY